METIALIHTSQTLPFIEFLENNGCPTEHLLKKAKLPLALLDRVDGFIPEQQLWQLLDVVAHYQGLNDYGFRVGQDINIEDLLDGLLPQLAQQPTLHALLDSFCQLVKEESSDAQFWLATSNDGDKHWFCRGGIPGIQVGVREAEQYTLMLMMELVRLATHPQWLPKSIRLQSNDHNAVANWNIFNNANISLGQNVTAIEIPSYCDNRLNKTNGLSCLSTQEPLMTAQKQESPAKDFADSLSQVLELYLQEASTDIKTAAEIVGVSPRTLQRRLAKEGLGYSQLVDKVRFKSAIPLLNDKNNKLIDVAFDLGYSDPSHFSRAFKRWSGVSPREFRQQLSA